MNLPHHRHILNGRTYGAMWRATDSDPITRYPSSHRIYGVLLAVGLGVALALSLVHWWAS